MYSLDTEGSIYGSYFEYVKEVGFIHFGQRICFLYFRGCVKRAWVAFVRVTKRNQCHRLTVILAATKNTKQGAK